MRMQSTKQQNKQRYVNEDEEVDGKRFEAKMLGNDDAKGFNPKLPSRSKSKSNDTNAPRRESPEGSSPSIHPQDGDASSTSQIRNITSSDILIAVMGMTGVGKSTFINYFADQKAEVGDYLESCTWKVALHPCTLPDDTKVFLVDTPGFDDTNKSDTDILGEVANWLNKAYETNIKLTGIIYLHRIIDVRLGGSGMKNIRMFKALCGDKGLESVVLATTFWSKVTLEEGEKRETQLRSTPKMWQKMIEKGSRVFRQDRGKASALEIIRYLIDLGRPTNLAIQEEMSKGAKLEETAAGQEVHADIEKKKKEFEEQLRELREDLAKADLEHQQELEDMMTEVREEQRQAIENERKLAAGREELRLQKEAEDREERREFLEEMTRLRQEVARSEYDFKLMQQKNDFELQKQRLELVTSQAQADATRARNELVGRERERKEKEEKADRDMTTLRNQIGVLDRKLSEKGSCVLM